MSSSSDRPALTRSRPRLRNSGKKIFIKKQLIKPDVFFYNAGLPENLPKSAFFGGPTGEVNPGGVLAWEVRKEEEEFGKKKKLFSFRPGKKCFFRSLNFLSKKKKKKL